MKRSIAGIVLAGALLVPGQLVSATSASAAAEAPAAVADSGSGGCTSAQPPTCSSGLAKVLVDVLSAISTGSSKGGGAK
ncbi:hypothetical protein [Nocardia sp. NPDC052566]|uniref:hypothetical protein n=1 Tax=Nocardia sp. NPDC052566 TaxID=3364330 RepID=UPI0037C9EF24